MRKDQHASDTARAEVVSSDADQAADRDLAQFSAADRIWAEAWSAAADDGGWMVDDTRPGYPSGPLFVYPPASGGRGGPWRRENQTPYTVIAHETGVVVEDPLYAGLPPRQRTFANLRAALVSLADLTPSLLSLVDALAEARADFGHGAELAVVPSFRKRRGGA